jgi:rhodanese-related sulfurtransferase/DNA-binding transcriptional ArsR family regulator
MADRHAKDDLFTALASVAKALGNGHRAEIVDVLAQGERSVEEIAHEIDESMANTSHHLQLLHRSGLVRTRRAGTRVIYRLAGDRVGELWSALRDVAADHVAEVGVFAAAYLGDRAGVEQLSAEELDQRLSEGRIVVLDVRPSQEFEAGHIDGAYSAPVSELPHLVERLPDAAEFVVYCRGPYCAYADEAIELLRTRGFVARRLDTGFPEWRRAGLPVAVSAQ